MQNLINALLMILSAVLIVIIILQPSKTDGLTSALMGDKNLTLFAAKKARGGERKIEIATAIMIAVFFLLCLASAHI